MCVNSISKFQHCTERELMWCATKQWELFITSIYKCLINYYSMGLLTVSSLVVSRHVRKSKTVN